MGWVDGPLRGGVAAVGLEGWDGVDVDLGGGVEGSGYCLCGGGFGG